MCFHQVSLRRLFEKLQKGYFERNLKNLIELCVSGMRLIEQVLADRLHSELTILLMKFRKVVIFKT